LENLFCYCTITDGSPNNLKVKNWFDDERNKADKNEVLLLRRNKSTDPQDAVKMWRAYKKDPKRILMGPLTRSPGHDALRVRRRMNATTHEHEWNQGWQIWRTLLFRLSWLRICMHIEITSVVNLRINLDKAIKVPVHYACFGRTSLGHKCVRRGEKIKKCKFFAYRPLYWLALRPCREICHEGYNLSQFGQRKIEDKSWAKYSSRQRLSTIGNLYYLHQIWTSILQRY
jgi:hypothetical protein